MELVRTFTQDGQVWHEFADHPTKARARRARDAAKPGRVPRVSTIVDSRRSVSRPASPEAERVGRLFGVSR